MQLQGSAELAEEWSASLRARWAGQRAAAAGDGGHQGLWLDGGAARGIACGAPVAPVVVGEVNPAAFGDLIRLCAQLDRLLNGASDSQAQDHEAQDSEARDSERVSDILCAGLFPVRFRVFIRNHFLALSDVVLPGLSRSSAEPDFPCRSGADTARPGFPGVLCCCGRLLPDPLRIAWRAVPVCHLI